MGWAASEAGCSIGLGLAARTDGHSLALLRCFLLIARCLLCCLGLGCRSLLLPLAGGQAAGTLAVQQRRCRRWWLLRPQDLRALSGPQGL